jgi:GNAT superfamily N-acetyltransferase
MDAPRIVDALASGRAEDARAIVFEYLALTQAEAGLPVPQGIADLPPSLQAVHASLSQRHAARGTLLLAIDGNEVCGCVGLSRSDLTAPADGIVQRMYVRARHRRRGIARALMGAIHEHARQHGFNRLELNVMPSRVGAIEFYRRLDYQPMPDVEQWPYPAVWLRHDLRP